MTIEEIIRKCQNQEKLSEQEQILLEEWQLQQSDDADWLRYISSLKSDQQLARQLNQEYDSTYKKVRKELKLRQLKAKQLRLYRVASVAAVLAIVVISSVLLLHPLSPSNPSPYSAENFEKSTAPGTQTATLELADGSRMLLSAEAIEVVEDKSAVISIDKGRLLYAEKENEEAADTEEESDSLIYNTLTIPRKGEYQLQLSDGTKVWINAESSLRYPQKFKGSERRVFLVGEAYFEVSHQADTPFIVETDAQELTVLGTKFNISAFADEAQVQSTLVSGSVKIKLKESEAECLLVPNQQAVVNKAHQTLALHSVDPSEIIAWKEGFFSLENVNLHDFLHKLSRWYDVDFVFTSEELKKLTFKGSVPRYDDLVQVLEAIQLVSPVEFRYQKEEIEVRMEKEKS